MIADGVVDGPADYFDCSVRAAFLAAFGTTSIPEAAGALKGTRVASCPLWRDASRTNVEMPPAWHPDRTHREFPDTETAGESKLRLRHDLEAARAHAELACAQPDIAASRWDASG